ncbi:hypothetical protein MRB53_038117 [Persea americana]|nr:hypothetical protein MRB53_038117 [Persea americana]
MSSLSVAAQPAMKKRDAYRRNIIAGGGAVVRRNNAQKSNVEFTSSLRANFSAAQHIRANGHREEHSTAPYTTWTSQSGDELFIPSLDQSKSGLTEAREKYEITAKLFFIPRNSASCRCAQTRSAIKLVLSELHVQSIDLLIVSYPGVFFDADDEDTGEPAQGTDHDAAEAEDMSSMIDTWKCLEELHDEGVIKKLGVAEFGTERLSRFLARSRVRPSVNQINVRDCCVVPRPLILYAKQEKVELLTHNDSSNILPQGTVRELLGHGQNGAGILAQSHDQVGLAGNVEPQWVMKYTAVVKDRGVVESKGYFAMAELLQSS